ncbi:hypothetical protein [Aeromicrobium sp. Leaf350]|uniref:hypothetical protein n=1 Tax=Aeromicrobium sp. Leaf350 TaxID=2876565 RepID=UPI001E3E518A|nr:hypothetical protein [Aeromicrobium sp. Leaf350]
MEAPDGTRSGYGAVEADGSGIEVPTVPKHAHVWVNLTELRSKHAVLEYPGLILGWCRGVKGWEAHVVWTSPLTDGSGRVTAHLAWLGAHQLRPA